MNMRLQQSFQIFAKGGGKILCMITVTFYSMHLLKLITNAGKIIKIVIHSVLCIIMSVQEKCNGLMLIHSLFIALNKAAYHKVAS